MPRGGVVVETLNKKSVNRAKWIQFWRQDPVQAAIDIFGGGDTKKFDLDLHQKITLRQMWFNDAQTNIMSRGCGKTFLDGVCGALEAILKPGHRVGLIGPSYRQSKLMFAEVEKLYEKSPLFQESCAKPPVSSPESCYLKFKAAPGKVGSVIEALPLGTDGGKIRGVRYFSTYVDEAAQVPKMVLDVVVRGFMATSANPMEQVQRLAEQKRMLDEGLITEDMIKNPPSNKLVFSTTAFYQYNHAWERVSNLIDAFLRGKRRADGGHGDPSKFVFKGEALNGGQIPHRVMTDGKRGLVAFTSFDPSPGFMNIESIKESRREMSDYTFRMEYMAFFPPDSEGFFRRSVLDKARTHRSFGPVLQPKKGCLYTMGVDPARKSDNFSIAVFEVDPEAQEIRLVRVYAWNQKRFPYVTKMVRDIKKLYGIEYFEMDAGGGGTTIRDLLATKELCPPGERLILEQENDEFRLDIGDRHLGKLVEFSNYSWLHDAHYTLLSGLQHGLLKIAAKPPIVGEIWTPEHDEADEEIEKALAEMSSIVHTPLGQRSRWDTPTDSMRKDRYSAILIGYWAATKVMERAGKPKKLASGFWL
jgi:hypothetical protein